MNRLKFLLLTLTCAMSIHAHALLITDAIAVNKQLENGANYSFDFDLKNQGYNYLTDTIKFIYLAYDFSEIVDNGHDPDNIETWENGQFNSRLFVSRAYYPDIDPGILLQSRNWTASNECQYYDPEDGSCQYNIDLDGRALELFSPYNDNLWLTSVTLSMDVERLTVPEPSSIILIGLALMALVLRRFSIKR